MSAEGTRQIYVAELCSSNENERDAPTVSEVEDVVQGSEPGASRFSMLIPTDVDDAMATLADTDAGDDIAAERHSHGTIEQLKDHTTTDLRNSAITERSLADGHVEVNRNVLNLFHVAIPVGWH